MMVPANRLLGWAGAVMVPLAAAATLFPEAGLLFGGLLVLLVAAVATDAWWGRARTRSVDVSLPPTCRLPAGREGRVAVSIHSHWTAPGSLRLGLPWPENIRPASDEVTLPLPAGESVQHLDWSCTARQRGVQVIEAAYWETASPWGFWRLRRRVPLHCELRAYPDLRGERRHVAALFLNRGGLGVHAQRMVGRGRDFEKLREYVPGDSYEDIHWKSTAKRGRPVTKLYQMERTQEVYVLLDVSRLSGRPAPAVGGGGGIRGDLEPGTEPVALDRFVASALVLALAAGRQGDLFGMLTFSDRVHAFLRARNGPSHYQACREVLLRTEPRTVAPDFEEMFTWVRLRLRRRALLVVLTALDDPLLSEAFLRSAELVERQHLVLVNLLRPHGVEPLFTRPEMPTVNRLYEALGGHLRWCDLHELQQRLQHRGVRLNLLENERLSADLVRQYLEVKRRQQL